MDRLTRREVPTARDLISQGLATALDWNKKTNHPTVVRISPEGHALLGEIMRHNGRIAQMTDTVPCPSCQAPAGQPCTRPTDNGRVPVTYMHMARTEENAS